MATYALSLISRRAKQEAHAWIEKAPLGAVLKLIIGKGRTTDQNSKMWACLTDISRQVTWHGQKLTPDDWKDVLTAALKRSRVVPGIDGGFVVLGQRTSEMTKADFIELIELITAFGAQHGVIWSEEKQ